MLVVRVNVVSFWVFRAVRRGREEDQYTCYDSDVVKVVGEGQVARGSLRGNRVGRCARDFQ